MESVTLPSIVVTDIRKKGLYLTAPEMKPSISCIPSKVSFLSSSKPILLTAISGLSYPALMANSAMSCGNMVYASLRRGKE